MTTLSLMVPQCTTDPEAMAAPTSPPISACDDEDGRPKYQVMRFQAIAPTTAENTTTRPCDVSGASMMLPTVLATFTETSDPARLNTAARANAALGVRARVDTEVAMALAASWNPLVKSNPSATKMRMSSPSVSTPCSGLLDGDRFDGVGDVLERVSRGLQLLGHLLQLEHHQRVDLTVEQPRHEPSVLLVGLVLEPVDLDPVVAQVLQRLQPGHGLRGQLRGAHEQLGQLVHLARQRVEVVEHYEVTGGLEEVHDVIKAACEAIDVLAVDRRHERRVDLTQDAVGLVVASMFLVTELGVQAVAVVLRTRDQGLQGVRPVEQVARGGCEQRVEDVLLRRQFQPHPLIPRSFRPCPRFGFNMLGREPPGQGGARPPQCQARDDICEVVDAEEDPRRGDQDGHDHGHRQRRRSRHRLRV